MQRQWAGGCTPSRGRQGQWQRALGAADRPRQKLQNGREFQTPAQRPGVPLSHWKRAVEHAHRATWADDRHLWERTPHDRVAGFLLLLSLSGGWRGGSHSGEPWGTKLEGAEGPRVITPLTFSPGPRRSVALTQPLTALIAGLLLCPLPGLVGRLSSCPPLTLGHFSPIVPQNHQEFPDPCIKTLLSEGELNDLTSWFLVQLH